MLISLDNVTKYFADRLILENITASVSDGDRIGLVGVNGAGKSTLINLICGMDYESGTISKAQSVSIGYLKQDSGLTSRSTIRDELYGVFSDVLAAGARIDEINLLLSTEKDEDKYTALSRELERLRAFFDAKDGYGIDVRINKILGGMGFADVPRDTVIDTLSGGEKTRLAIAKLLLEEPSLLILDEPTNHLDFETLSWLEGYLLSYKGAILVVSHDRYFLDKLVTRIWEVEDHRLMTFKGNYSAYKVQKAEYILHRQREYEKQQEQIRSMKEFAERNIVRATTSTRAKSRLHQLENMEIIEAPRTYTKPPSISFELDAPSVKELLGVNIPRLYAGDKLLCEGLSFNVQRGARVAIIGRNGCGKSTLMKRLLAAHELRESEISWGKNSTVAYYEQEGRNLNPENTLLDEIRTRYPRLDQTSARGYLGRVLLSGEEVFKQVKVLSGGERARLSLAIIMPKRANTLLLDEPTNHIDLMSREALEEALKKYEGTIIFVSHDRYLINAVATHVLSFEDNTVKMYEGGFDAYSAKRSATLAQRAMVQEKERIQKAQSENEVQYYRSKKQRSEDAAKKRRISALEALIEELDARMAEIEALLSDEAVASDFEKVSALCTELEEIKIKQEESEEEWLTLSM